MSFDFSHVRSCTLCINQNTAIKNFIAFKSFITREKESDIFANEIGFKWNSNRMRLCAFQLQIFIWGNSSVLLHPAYRPISAAKKKIFTSVFMILIFKLSMLIFDKAYFFPFTRVISPVQ